MSTPARIVRRPATYGDLCAAPEDMVAELIHGALHLQPRPRPRHAKAMASLAGAVEPAFGQGRGGPGGWVVLIEPEVHLGEDVLVPELAAWRRERLPELPETVGIATPPDWVCEVLSPSTRAWDLTDKRAIYASAGVGWLWFVDPEARTLEAFALTADGWTLTAAARGEATVVAPPFEAAPFALEALWGP